MWTVSNHHLQQKAVSGGDLLHAPSCSRSRLKVRVLKKFFHSDNFCRIFCYVLTDCFCKSFYGCLVRCFVSRINSIENFRIFFYKGCSIEVSLLLDEMAPMLKHWWIMKALSIQWGLSELEAVRFHAYKIESYFSQEFAIYFVLFCTYTTIMVSHTNTSTNSSLFM